MCKFIQFPPSPPPPHLSHVYINCKPTFLLRLAEQNLRQDCSQLLRDFDHPHHVYHGFIYNLQHYAFHTFSSHLVITVTHIPTTSATMCAINAFTSEKESGREYFWTFFKVDRLQEENKWNIKERYNMTCTNFFYRIEQGKCMLASARL